MYPNPSGDKVKAVRITLAHLQKKRREGERLTMVACYDATATAVVENAGVEIILVCDSPGMLVQGGESTLSVSIDGAIYHTRCVARAARRVTCRSAATRRVRSRRSRMLRS